MASFSGLEPVQLGCLMAAGKLSQLADQFLTLFGRDEPGGLHRVHQELQLRQLEEAGTDEV